MVPLNLEKLTVLIVNDNQNIVRLVRSILKALGVGNVILAGDGRDAYGVISRMSIDIVISDWNMAPMDGIELVRKLRKADKSPNPYIAIIMLTGHTEVLRVLEARDAGVDEFLAKPISASALYGRIERVIRNRREFVRAPGYFGPDRRRHVDDNYAGPPRRAADRTAEEQAPIEPPETVAPAREKAPSKPPEPVEPAAEKAPAPVEPAVEQAPDAASQDQVAKLLQ